MTNSQQALDLSDKLRAPFYSIAYRYGAEVRDEDDSLHDIVSTAVYCSDMGEHYLFEIGDADGPLWRMQNPGGWETFDRAPSRTPEQLLGED